MAAAATPFSVSFKTLVNFSQKAGKGMDGRARRLYLKKKRKEKQMSHFSLSLSQVLCLN